MTRYEEIRITELEVKPNKLVSYGLICYVICGVAIWMLNEAGIFLADKDALRLVGFFTLIIAGISLALTSNPKMARHKSTKYVLVGLCLLCNFITLIFLYQWAIMLTSFPLMFASVYNNKRINTATYIGCVFTAIFTAAYSMSHGMWSDPFIEMVLGASGDTVIIENTATPDLVNSAVLSIIHLGIPNAILVTIVFLFVMRTGRNRIDNADLYIKSIMLEERDLATGVYNRISLMKRLDEFQARYTDEQIYFVCTDAHGLCDVNRREGTEGGDRMLKFIADRMVASFGDDTTFRMGGGVFLSVVLPGSDVHTGIEVEDLREQLKDNNYNASIGVFANDKERDLKRLISDIEVNMRDERAAFYRNTKNDRRRSDK